MRREFNGLDWETRRVPAPTVLALDGVSRHRGKGESRVLANDAISFDVAAGEVVGLLGPNGAGKTTCVRQVVGLLAPESGGIRLLGHDAVADPGVAGRTAAYLAQTEPALEDMPVSVAVETTARMRGLSKRDAATARAAVLDELDIGSLAKRPLLLLSGGERRLAAVAAALVGDRPILVLDEPTTGLDAIARRLVWSALARRRREAGAAVLLVTHNVLEAETVLDRVAVLEKGRVVAFDTPGRLKASVSDEVRLELVWRSEPPLHDPAVSELAARRLAGDDARRWSLRMPADEARSVLAAVTGGPAFAALDDFTLATPSLEDVYLALGGQARDLDRL